MNLIKYSVLLTITLLSFDCPLAVGQGPRPKVEPKMPDNSTLEKRTKASGKIEYPGTKIEKWENGRQKDGFNKAAQAKEPQYQNKGEAGKKEPEKRNAFTTTEKRDKWDKGQNVEKFNKAAQGLDKSPPPKDPGRTENSTQTQAVVAPRPGPRL